MRAFFFILFLTSTTSGETKELLSKLLRQESLDDRERRELVELVFRRPEELTQILQSSLPDGLNEAGKTAHSSVIETSEEDRGFNRMGAAVGWFLQFHKEELSSLPVLSKLRKGSPAAKAGLRRGDVIYSVEGHILYDAESRNRFVTLLKLWPSNTPLQVTAFRNPKNTDEGDLTPRHQRYVTSLNLAKRKF